MTYQSISVGTETVVHRGHLDVVVVRGVTGAILGLKL